MKKTYYTNEQISDMLREIIRQMHDDNYRPSCVVGLSRGGLDIGIKMSHYLDVPFEPLKWQTRNGNFQDRENLSRILEKYESVLFIDDILDSGRSLAEIKMFIDDPKSYAVPDHRLIPEYKIAVLIENISAESGVGVDYAATEINKAEDPAWICFPWETWWAPSLRN
jgi:hypoxanthine phosphoribosyltransferase